MLLDWLDIAEGRLPRDGTTVEIAGWPLAGAFDDETDRFVLLAEPACCAGCLPSHPLAALEVETLRPIGTRDGRLRLRGLWASRIDATGVRRCRLVAAAATGPRRGPTRRRLLRGAMVGGPAMAGALVCTALPSAAQVSAQRSEMAARPTVDVHSHAGRVLYVNQGGPGSPLADPMRRGSLSVVCLAMVADSPTVKLEGGRLRPYRDPRPGELYEHAQKAFARLHKIVAEQGLAIVRDAAGLPTPAMNRPSAIVSAEGADFLEGRIERLDEVLARWQLRHLQLTHYRPNELGDIQTEPAVHNDLTAFGIEVVRRCNRLGIVVDVAHATYAMVKKAASVTARPLVLSHTSLTERPLAFTRRILPDHARLIAQTRGVIGIWPVSEYFPTLAAYAEGMARMADIVGPAHVGLGSDMLGLVGASVFPEYDLLPDLHAALRKRFSAEETAGILGGNYARVFAETLRG